MRPPTAADRTLLPAALAGLLALGLALVFAVPATTALPPVAVVAPRRLPVTAPVEPLATGEALLAAPIFAPDRQPGAAASAADTAADAGLPGVVVTGIVRVGRQVHILVRDDSRLLSLSPGDRLRGWRIAGVDNGGVIFDRDGQRRHLAIGAPAANADDPSADEQALEDQ